MGMVTSVGFLVDWGGGGGWHRSSGGGGGGVGDPDWWRGGFEARRR